MRSLKPILISLFILLPTTSAWAYDSNCLHAPLDCVIMWLAGQGAEADRREQAERIKRQKECVPQAKAQGYPQKMAEDMCSGDDVLSSQDWWGHFAFYPLEMYKQKRCEESTYDLRFQYDTNFYYQEERVFNDMLEASYYCDLTLPDVAQKVVGEIIRTSTYITQEERIEKFHEFHAQLRINYNLPQKAYEACLSEGNSVSACEAVREHTKTVDANYRSAQGVIAKGLRGCKVIEDYYLRLTIDKEGFHWIPQTEEHKIVVEAKCQKHLDDFIRGLVPEFLYDGPSF